MNAVVVVVAGVLLLTGIALVVLSVLVRNAKRGTRGDLAPEAGETALSQGGLETSAIVPEAASGFGAALAAGESATPPIPIDLSDGQAATYDVSVEAGFRFLNNGEYENAVTEFQKALALTDNKEAKLSLYMDIGNDLRQQKAYRPAAAAYIQAAALARNDQLRAEIETYIEEMVQRDTTGMASSANGGEG